MIRWNVIAKFQPEAVSDLMNYLSHKHNVPKRSIYVREQELVFVGTELEVVSILEVIEWLADNWKIYLNIGTYTVGGDVRINFHLSFIKEGKFFNTKLVEGFDCYKDLVDEACKMGLKGVEKRIKKVK